MFVPTISNPLDVSYINGVGTATYQWYENTVNNNSGNFIPGATSSSYTPPVFNTIGSYYYYCEITLSGNGCDVVILMVAQVDVINSPSKIISTKVNAFVMRIKI